MWLFVIKPFLKLSKTLKRINALLRIVQANIPKGVDRLVHELCGLSEEQIEIESEYEMPCGDNKYMGLFPNGTMLDHRLYYNISAYHT
jgi:hypothetical protein